MATTSTGIAIDPGSNTPDAASLRFDRLARVRALRRARRRKRVVLITLLVAALTGVGVLALTSGRGTSSESTGAARPRPPIAAPTPAVVPTLAPAASAAPASTLAPAAPLAPASTLAPAPTLTAPPPRPPVPHGGRAAAPAPRRGAAAEGPSAGETDAGDGSAAIDWLLKTRSP